MEKNLDYKLLENNTKRIKIAYFNSTIEEKLKSKLSFIEKLYNEQGD